MRETVLDVETSGIRYSPTEVATAMSCGIDSMHTLLRHSAKEAGAGRAVTLLTFFENGAPHPGRVSDEGEREEVMEGLFLGQLSHAKRFCDAYGHRLLSVRSNLDSLLRSLFEHWPFEWTHTYRNAGFALLFQRAIKTYLYSSTYGQEPLTFGLKSDPAHYEGFLLPCLSTGSTVFEVAGAGLSRVEKTAEVASFEPSWEHLLVCSGGDGNCGTCLKCVRTLVTLDLLGFLDRYGKSFDIGFYRKNRSKYLADVCGGRRSDAFYGELYRLAREKGVRIPLRSRAMGAPIGLVRGSKILRPAKEALYEPLSRLFWRRR